MGATGGEGHMDVGKKRAKGLQANFTPLGIWALSIGTSIGWGSFIVTCNVYLQKAGILGTSFGLLVGMAVILVITWNLQHMIQSAPDAGGIYTFAKRVGGKDLGFLAAWFVLLTYMAILWANITSVPLFARFFLGNTFQFGIHYRVFGYEVWLGEALLSIGAVLLVGLLCARSQRLSQRVLVVTALAFAAGFTVCAIIAIVRHGSTYSYHPLYAEGANAFAQVMRIAVISPWAFIGFENVSHFSEEYAFPLRKVRPILLASVLATTALYLLVSLLSVSAYPAEYESWMAYISDMGNLSGIKAVPAFYAAEHYLGQAGVVVLMLALLGVIVTSMIGNLLAVSRLLYAAGREGDAPASFKRVNAQGIPIATINAVIAVSLFVPFLGRTAIGWIVDVTTLGATIIYGMVSYCVFRLASAKELRRERLTGIVGIVLMALFMLLLLIPGLLPFHAMENESYVLFIVWSLLGLAYYRKLVRWDRHRDFGQNYIVWVILLVLVLFASMMWVSRATEGAAERAIQDIYEYHVSHPTDDSNEQVREERVAFLQKQADRISNTNTLYTIVSLGLFLLSTTIMANNYRDTRELGRQLSAAEQEAEAARKIAELKASIAALMDNMPCLSYSKDAQTGVYLACNQAFAEYAHRDGPEGVIGLTDADIFDPATAAHFVEDDKMALAMDEPFIFYEEVPDAAGNRRQFQTTKLKYVDEDGQLCTLGLSQDVTELVRIRRENVSTKEAYERVRSAGIIYTHIAQALARGYTDLYYVNLDTDEFIEYLTDERTGGLVERRQGECFFDTCMAEAAMRVYHDDQPTFMKAMERETLLRALGRSKSFIMTFRLVGEQGPTYVTMKVSRMEDDESIMVIGVSDVDDQVRQQRAAERYREERIAYARLSALAGNFLCVYVVVPDEVGRYREYSSASDYEAFGLAKDGFDFFGTTRELAKRVIYPADRERFLSEVTREGVLAKIEQDGIFTLSYRLIYGGKSIFVQLKAALVNEREGQRLIVGVNDVDVQVRQEEEYARRLAQAQSRAHIDALTGVKNKRAYLDAEGQLDRQIAEHRQPEFAITILDVNDLKRVNDSGGHQAGDQYLRTACNIVCTVFKHSPVFRVGGDEFAVISQGSDYAHIEELIGRMGDHNAKALRTGGIVIACGMAKFDNDVSVATVFERADLRMYQNKDDLKSGTGTTR